MSVTNAAEAHVAAAALESAGIAAVIHGEHMGSFPAGPASRPSVWVQDEDYEAACRLVGVVPEPPAAPVIRNKSPLWIFAAVVLLLLLLLLVRG